MYYGKFSYSEVYNLPVAYKRWFIDRIVSEKKRAAGAPDDNDGDVANAVNSVAQHAKQAVQPQSSQPPRMKRF